MAFQFNDKKAFIVRLSDKKYRRTQAACLGLALVIGSFCTWKTIEMGMFYNEESLRIPSLSTPKVVQQIKQEQNVLLNDPAIKKNWGLLGTGGVSDINVDKAWKITMGSRKVVVAIIDTGIDINHPDIKNNLWVNEEEKNGKAGIDDDNNGCIDDIHGCNFITGTGSLTDNHGHGTHIAGIVGAEGGNGIGISGVSPKVSLMILKYYDPKAPGTDNLKNTIKAIHYAVDKKVDIINYSGGGLDYSQTEFEAVKRANDAGILFVAAAGNEKSNSDKAHYYPANYNLPNIISVTAINAEANVLQSSNYGMKTVHIAAPGEGIYSTLPGSRYGTMTGTSQATAFVSGVAALLKANNPEMTYLQSKNQILATADTRVAMFTKTQTAGILNSWAALAIHPAVPVSGIAAPTSNQILSNTTTVVDNNNRNPALSQQLNQLNQLLNTISDKREKTLN